MDNSGGKKRERQGNSNAIDAMPETLPESLNVSASTDLKSAKLFVAPVLPMYNVVFLTCLMFIFERPIQITLFQNSFGISNKVTCYLPSPFLDKLLTYMNR